MAEDPQPMTLHERIRMLNSAHIGQKPGEPPLIRPKPHIPRKRPSIVKQKSVNNPPEQVTGSIADTKSGNLPNGTLHRSNVLPPPAVVKENPCNAIPARTPPPPLPKRQPSQPPPPLPSRESSQEVSRRGSGESGVSSVADSLIADGARHTATRTKSIDGGRVKAPAWGDAELPTLPPRGGAAIPPPRNHSSDRPKYVNRAPSCTASITPGTSPPREVSDQRRPSLPHRRPSRKSDNAAFETGHASILQNGCPRSKPPPMPSPAAMEKIKRSALSFGLNKPEEQQSEASEVATANLNGSLQHPPPVPLSSRPDLSAINLSKPRPSTAVSRHRPHASQDSITCMVCRDFAAPDHQATLFPRSQVNSLQTLAQHLTYSFPSPTDKARAIFTWLHHNIRYDVVSFFANNVRPSTPQMTLQTGLAVCEGYAALFSNLATHAGLESVVVSGHGKGFGFRALADDAPLPPYTGNHAWNAVKIDNGEWKLIDACWGAGHCQGKGFPYEQAFHEECFTMSNEEFGTKHYPSNKEQFYLPGGRTLSWEDYIQINPANWPNLEEPPTVFTNAKLDYGIGEKTVMPRRRRLSPRGSENVRFQFGLLCPHWTLEQHTRRGAPPVFILAIHGLDGRNKEHIALEHVQGQTPSGGGDFWYVDVPAKDLGTAGQTVTLFAVTSFGDRTSCRGLTAKEFKEGKGRVAMGFTGVASWELA